MRYSLALILTLPLFALGCQSSVEETSSQMDYTEESEEQTESSTATEPVSFNLEGAPTLELKVPGMMCEVHCGPAVKKQLIAQPGVKDVKVDLDTKIATVAIDREVFKPQEAVAALVDIQFTDAHLVESESAEAKGEAATDDSDEQPAEKS